MSPLSQNQEISCYDGQDTGDDWKVVCADDKAKFWVREKEVRFLHGGLGWLGAGALTSFCFSYPAHPALFLIRNGEIPDGPRRLQVPSPDSRPNGNLRNQKSGQGLVVDCTGGHLHCGYHGRGFRLKKWGNRRRERARCPDVTAMLFCLGTGRFDIMVTSRLREKMDGSIG